MGRSISLFSGYDQKENRTTNYCLLILKLLYDESPRLLAEFLSTLGGETLGNLVGVKFSQQERSGKSVPDGVIRQRSFTIFVETKNSNWFYKEQLQSHLDGLASEQSDCKVLIALSSFGSSKEQDQVEQIADLCPKDVRVMAASFEQFYDSLPKQHLTNNLEELIAEFRAYLDQEGLLPSWRYKLDVVNCAGLPDDVLKHRVYICPAEGGAYSHQRSQFFGMYAGNKRVEQIALIRAVVDVTDETNGTLLWKNVSEPNASLIQEAIAKVQELRSEYPHRVFLLGELHSTVFTKDTPGGLMGSKIYFDLSAFTPTDAKEVAARLHNQTWRDITGQPQD